MLLNSCDTHAGKGAGTQTHLKFFFKIFFATRATLFLFVWSIKVILINKARAVLTLYACV